MRHLLLANVAYTETNLTAAWRQRVRAPLINIGSGFITAANEVSWKELVQLITFETHYRAVCGTIREPAASWLPLRHTIVRFVTPIVREPAISWLPFRSTTGRFVAPTITQ